MRSLVLFFCFMMLFLSCAYRDNSFDPQSPLHRIYPPELTVAWQFDSSQINASVGDTVYAFTPLDITISASSKGKKDADLEIRYQHFINGIQQEIDFVEDSVNITLQDSGTHLICLQSTEETGKEIATEQKVIVLCHKAAPRVVSFYGDRSTLLAKQLYQILFLSEIVDSGRILDKIIYAVSSSDNLIKTVRNRSTIVRDTVLYSFHENDTGIQIVTLKAVDILGRVDSMNFQLHFISNSTEKNPPVINNISYYPLKINTMQEVTFGVSYTSSSEKITRYWSYGDLDSMNWTTESTHRFETPGTYVVRVMIKDDSNASAIDSISVQVDPSVNIAPKISGLTITPDSGSAPLLVRFSVSATDSDGKIRLYKWITGTGYETMADSHYIFTYWYPEKYPVTVIAYDDKWGTDTIHDTIVVTGEMAGKPVLAAYPVPAFTYQDIYFKLENAPPEYSNAEFIWNFGKKSFKASRSHHYSFQSSGDYEVKLTVVTDDSTHEFTVPVKIVQPFMSLPKDDNP